MQLIFDYQRATHAAVAALKNQFGSSNLLADLRAGKIPRKGSLDEYRGRFQFHGIGCRFDISKRVVDVDFGPGGRCDGFDAWRLHKYAESAFDWQSITLEEIEKGIQALELSKLICHLHNPMVQHLYFLNEK